jgi:hypothetical protein
MELTRPREPLTVSLIVNVWAVASSTKPLLLNVPHWSDQSGPGGTVEDGDGSEFEQLIPEQGLGRPGSGCSPGNRAKIGTALNPATINSSSAATLPRRSDWALLGWLQPARVVPHKTKPWSSRSVHAPV